MIVCVTRFSESRLRPKYTPRAQWPDKCLMNTETKEIIYGPATHAECMRRMDLITKIQKEQRSRLNGNSN